MKVADLQQHLADLGRMLEAAGAKPVAADLSAIQAGLTPFRDLPLKGFADFLVRAEAYRTGGEVPTGASKAGGSGKGAPGKTSAKPAPDANALAQEVRHLYDRAADPSVTTEQIDALAGRLTALPQKGLVVVAEAIDMKGMKSKKKDDILSAIRNRIHTRKGASQKAGMIDRLGKPASTPAPSGCGGVGATSTPADG
jgi:hypothetical protein